jgi:foldase protein PrsA
MHCGKENKMKKILIFTALMGLVSGLVCAQERVIATVNGAKITSADITKKLWWQYSAQSLSELIDEKLLMEEAARLKVPYDAKEADKRFETLSAGYKDKSEFENSLKAVGWTGADVKELIKRQLLIKATVIAAKNVKVTDADVKAFFEQNKEKLGKPANFKLLQIYVGTKAEADDAALSLSAGADFAKLSGLKSTDENLRKKNGDIGSISKGMLIPEIEKEISALTPGQHTKPIPTGNGYSIFKLESSKPGESAKFTDTLRTELKTGIINQVVTQKLPELISELRQKAKIEIAR